MTGPRVYIAGVGIVSPLGSGLDATEAALRENRSALAPLRVFSLLRDIVMPVGQVDDIDESASLLPRTHRLARKAADMAMEDGVPPDAVVIGTTTGGILTTERLLREGEQDKIPYRYHGLTSVAEDIAAGCGCLGPAITVSTACSSGAVAIALALRLLRTGRARRVLAGGVDSLCRLTCFGFHSLQLVDRNGCRPMDARRRGMAVAEGAAMVLLTTLRPEAPLAEVLGAGLSCDAHHPAAPHPEGRGAYEAMREALADAGLRPSDIGYINLHGTGTPENDQAEAAAIRRLFSSPPPLSSIKGATGHSLAAAGAIEAVVAALAVSRNLIPANTGGDCPDPALGLIPEARPRSRQIKAVLSNSFGFGGNNGCLVIGRPDCFPSPPARLASGVLAIHGCACLTGAGALAASTARLEQGLSLAGMVPSDQLTAHLSPRLIRRLKRLSRLSLSLAVSALADSGLESRPAAVFMGTGWGALSETYDFLSRLSESAEQFPSPTDFVGSVHNGAASQTAIYLAAAGANITTSGGDVSFEQALLAAELFLGEPGQSALVLAADEGHEPLSALFDPSVMPGDPLAEGGGAFLVSREMKGARCLVRMPFYRSGLSGDGIGDLLDALGGPSQVASEYGLVLAGVPAAMQDEGTRQLEIFQERTEHRLPLCRYRGFTGEFASASAVAALIAVSCFAAGKVPAFLSGTGDVVLDRGKKILVLGTGRFLTSMEFFLP